MIQIFLSTLYQFPYPKSVAFVGASSKEAKLNLRESAVLLVFGNTNRSPCRLSSNTLRRWRWDQRNFFRPLHFSVRNWDGCNWLAHVISLFSHSDRTSFLNLSVFDHFLSDVKNAIFGGLGAVVGSCVGQRALKARAVNAFHVQNWSNASEVRLSKCSEILFFIAVLGVLVYTGHRILNEKSRLLLVRCGCEKAQTNS